GIIDSSATTGESGPKYTIVTLLKFPIEQHQIIGRVRSVGHDNRHNVTLEIGQPAPHGKTKPIRRIIIDAAHGRAFSSEGFNPRFGRIEAVIVYHQDLKGYPLSLKHRNDPLHSSCDVRFFI